MTAKEHYDHHLGNFYTWMTGNFNEKQREQQDFFTKHNLLPSANKIAMDLGAGHGLQAISLAHLGFSVKAVDFNAQLISELYRNKQNLDIEIIQDDVLEYLKNTDEKAELIVCMGDTLTHLENLTAVDMLFHQVEKHLLPLGKISLSFRDLTIELKNEQRFIPVKSDNQRMLTCFLEYFPTHVMIHDILHENKDGRWTQKVSAYPKLRLSERKVVEMLAHRNLKVTYSETINRMIYLVAEKAQR